MTEAGLPVIVHRGREGGIESGSDYRTRLTGLDTDEATAMGMMLSLPLDRLVPFGIAEAGARARAKIREVFPDQARAAMAKARNRFGVERAPAEVDPRIPALARAVVRLCTKSGASGGAGLPCNGWAVRDPLNDDAVIQRDWGGLNISAKRFA